VTSAPDRPAGFLAVPGPRDDRILPEVHWIAGLVVIVLLIAAAILYLFPDKTTELFAWTIRPDMSALLMGAGYAAGAYFFARVFIGPRWHWVGTYFPGIALFTLIQGIGTVLHWDRFNHSHIAFYAWAFLYFTTPVLIPILWLRNRATDPGTPDPDDVVVPQPIRLIVGFVGVVMLLLVVVMVMIPDVMIPVWPWQLTTLTCRATGGWLSAPGLTYLLFAFEPRWSAWRITLQHHALAVGLILLAAVRAWGDFNPANPATWVFVAGMSFFFFGIIGLHVYMDAQRGRVDAGPTIA
jgi:hypothetical protein